MKNQNFKNSIVFDAAGGILAILAIITAAGMLALIGFLFYPEDPPGNGYVPEKNGRISAHGSEKAGTRMPEDQKAAGNAFRDREQAEGVSQAGQENESAAEKLVFRELTDTRVSLGYFRHLEHMFRKASTMGEHLDKARQHLKSLLPAKQAEKIYNTYKAYLQCETQLQNEFRDFSEAKNPREAIEMLSRIQEFRRAQLGEQLADRLFGNEVREKKYAFRRAAIISDNSLYGREKEKRIRQLDEHMQGGSEPEIKDRKDAYRLYRQKLKIYRKDLAEMESEEARLEKKREFRHQIFDSETVEALQSVDRQIAEERRREKTYAESKKQIQQNPDLSGAEKQGRIDALRVKIFGNEADAARRREAIRNAGNEGIKND
ncbi:MAG: lipase secretion chaperone [Desulfosalsimonas sp.]